MPFACFWLKMAPRPTVEASTVTINGREKSTGFRHGRDTKAVFNCLKAEMASAGSGPASYAPFRVNLVRGLAIVEKSLIVRLKKEQRPKNCFISLIELGSFQELIASILACPA